MVNPVHSASQASYIASLQKQAQAAPSPGATQKPDSVELSAAAKATADVDHDGDSH